MSLYWLYTVGFLYFGYTHTHMTTFITKQYLYDTTILSDLWTLLFYLTSVKN